MSVRHSTQRPRGIGKSGLSVALLAAGFLSVSPTNVCADDIAVPLALEVSLLAKVCSYDRNLEGRAKDRTSVLLVVKPGVAESQSAAGELQRRFEDLGQIAGRPVSVERLDYTSAAELGRVQLSRRFAIIYFCPGFSDREIEASAESLATADVLTVATVASYVEHGVVLGFDLVSGKPKIEINLSQARRQHVEFRSELLALAKVIK